MSKIVGIDLGTTNSVVAVVEGGEPEVIPMTDGARLLPSVFGISRSGERLVGQLAKRQAISSPERTVSSIKRRMGSDAVTPVGGRNYTPQEISAQILSRLREDAEAYLGSPVTRAVITVPAYFSDAQRQATKDAGAIAGLDVVRIINEPTAAALAYGMGSSNAQTVLVWDLGGGTFDVSILTLCDGVFEVKATSGDTQLGGDDWDQAVMDWIVSEFRVEAGVDLSRDRMAVQRLKEAAEKAKMELSAVVTTSVNLPFISVTSEGPVHLDLTLTRARFEELTFGLLNRMVKPTRQALADAHVQPEDIDRVLLVGGSTRMPAVQELVRSMFGQEPHRGLNPDEVVALGAAIQGGILGGDVKDIVLLDVTPLSLGIETLGGVFTRLIDRNTTIPTSRTQLFTTAVDNQSTVDIHVLQGERAMALGNKSLGRFQLTNIPPAPRGTPRIEVSFDIDVNGITHVSAKDMATGNKTGVTITSSTSLSREEVERLMADAEAMRAEDRRRRDLQNLRNRADSLIYNAQRACVECKDMARSSLVEDVREGIARLRSVARGDDLEALRAALDSLTESVYRLSQSQCPQKLETDGADYHTVVSDGAQDFGDVEEESLIGDTPTEEGL
ncbi:MAG: molecular chaperone DnaK [Armatimonadetes bacterium]|nr:molecular chaperone DnaK [Armatimonadota bacterium]